MNPSSYTVLVVDDQAAVRRLIVRVLAQRGYHLLEAGDAATALEIARLSPVSLVITDVVMPGMSGPHLVEALRRDRLASRCLLMSGEAAGIPARGSTWALPLLKKPFTPEELVDKVAKLLADEQ
jgi:two-component system, cell cycle sensor histidine kinase and response regulator CckA